MSGNRRKPGLMVAIPQSRTGGAKNPNHQHTLFFCAVAAPTSREVSDKVMRNEGEAIGPLGQYRVQRPDFGALHCAAWANSRVWTRDTIRQVL
jgi:hypothetical protein